MSVLSLFYILTSAAYVYMGIYVFNLYHKSRQSGSLHIVFFIFCMLLTFWSFNYAFLVSSENKEECWFWFKLSLPCLVFFPALISHFFLIFTSEKKNNAVRLLFPLLYIPGIIFLLRGLTGILTVSDFIRNSYGWEAIHAVGSPWYAAYTAYYISLLIFCLTATAFLYFKTDSRRKKKQAGVMIISASATAVVSILLQNVFPALNIHNIPKIAQITMLIWVSGIWYSIVRYKLMAPAPAFTSHEILSHINEIVAILNTELKIFMANNRFLEILSAEQDSIKNKDFFEFIYADEKTRGCFKDLTEGKLEQVRCRIEYKTAPGPVATDSYISRITDRFSDLIGILVISWETKGKKQFQAAFNISDREFEIIEQSITGLSSRRIGMILGIAERTVEKHLNNIYKKLGIGNKLELINIGYEFNLLRKT